jgi:hypothetical protein
MARYAFHSNISVNKILPGKIHADHYFNQLILGGEWHRLNKDKETISKILWFIVEYYELKEGTKLTIPEIF